jgi:hypothetical protein
MIHGLKRSLPYASRGPVRRGAEVAAVYRLKVSPIPCVRTVRSGAVRSAFPVLLRGLSTPRLGDARAAELADLAHRSAISCSFGGSRDEHPPRRIVV